MSEISALGARPTPEAEALIRPPDYDLFFAGLFLVGVSFFPAADVGDIGTWGAGGADPADVGDIGTWGAGGADPADVGDIGTWGADPAEGAGAAVG